MMNSKQPMRNTRRLIVSIPIIALCFLTAVSGCKEERVASPNEKTAPPATAPGSDVAKDRK